MTRTPNTRTNREALDTLRAHDEICPRTGHAKGCPWYRADDEGGEPMSGGLRAIVKATAEGWEAGNPDHRDWPLSDRRPTLEERLAPALAAYSAALEAHDHDHDHGGCICGYAGNRRSVGMHIHAANRRADRDYAAAVAALTAGGAA